MFHRLTHLLLVIGLLGVGCEDTIRPDITDTEEPEGVPNIVVRVTEVDFGRVAYGSRHNEQLSVENTGDGLLEITSVVAIDPFTTSYYSTIQVSGQSSTNLTVTFQPVSFQDVSGTLTITSNDPDESEIIVQLLGGVITDADGDGYDSVAAGGDDCDDDDDDVNPGATENYYDGKDQDCQGDDDYDQDKDGYQHEDENDDPLDGGNDCNDVNPAVNPAAEDVWYDNVDSNCDGLDDWDADMDGQRTTIGGKGLDCDDSDPDVNTLAIEQLDGRDNDCEGTVDFEAVAYLADTIYVGSATSEQAGWALTAGDLNDDGFDDLVVGANDYGSSGSSSRGGVFIFQGGSMQPDGSDMEDADRWLRGDGGSDQIGYEVAIPGDFDGDGGLDLAIGSPGYSSSAGAVYLLQGSYPFDYGLAGHSLDASDAIVTVTGTSTNYVGRGVSDDMDLNGDGLADLVSMYYTGSYNGLFLLYGDTGLSGTLSLSSVDARYSTGESGDDQYRNMPRGADLDGDGYQDLVLCSGDDTYINTTDGVVWILWGQSSQYTTSSESSFESTALVAGYGAKASSKFGFLCAPQADMDRDGDDELWVWRDSDKDLLLFEGGDDLRATGGVYPTEAVATYDGGTSTAEPDMMSSIGDWDGDRVSDFGIIFSASSTVPGRLWTYSSKVVSGNYDADDDVLASATADEDQGNVSYSSLTALPGDFDGDGDEDLAAGDYDWIDPSDSGSDQGAVYIYLNH